MKSKAVRKTLEFTQLNTGNIEEVFPLLCPVREKDWLDGWEYRMIYSKSGLIEQDCVFLTPNKNKPDTIWYVSLYDKVNFLIEFIRHAPGENLVKINIRLEKIKLNTTKTHISYQYTALSENQNNFINNDLEKTFTESMNWWEKAINFYLQNKEMLRREFKIT